MKSKTLCTALVLSYAMVSGAHAAPGKVKAAGAAHAKVTIHTKKTAALTRKTTAQARKVATSTRQARHTRAVRAAQPVAHEQATENHAETTASQSVTPSLQATRNAKITAGQRERAVAQIAQAESRAVLRDEALDQYDLSVQYQAAEPVANLSDASASRLLGVSLHSAAVKAEEVANRALGFLGVPYVFGGDSARTGFDCSGLVQSVYEHVAGVELPRTTAEQANATESIDKDDLRPGDLVFFNTLHRMYSHVGIYIGGGKFVHAPRTGANVRVEKMTTSYWRSRFNGARRVALR